MTPDAKQFRAKIVANPATPAHQVGETVAEDILILPGWLLAKRAAKIWIHALARAAL